MNRIPTNSPVMRNLLLLNALSRKPKHRLATTAKTGFLNNTPDVPKQRRTDPDAYDPHNNKYGYAWIDNFMFKRDSTGPLTEFEKETLNCMKTSLMLRQQELDAGWYGGKGGRANPQEWGLVDKDGYPNTMARDVAQSMVAKRDQKNADLTAALESKGLKLTEKDVFSLTINFDNTITVNGHADKARGKEIERALNDIDIGLISSLAVHIREAGNTFGPFSQCTFLEYTKYMTNWQLEKYTGYSINQLTVRSEGIFTDDGKDIMELFYDTVSKQHPEPGYASEYTDFTMRNIKQVAGVSGIQSVRDVSFTIEYRNNSLCDINTPVGFGTDQRDWYDKLLSLRGDLGQQMSYAASIGLLSKDQISALNSTFDLKA